MKRSILSGLLVLCLLFGLCGCTEPTEIGTSSGSETLSEVYSYSEPLVPEPVIPDYSEHIGKAAEWLFRNASYLTCDEVWAATAIEATGHRGTSEASELFSVKTAADVDLGKPAEVAKLVICAVMMGEDPKTYIPGLDLVETLLDYRQAGGWFSAQYTDPIPADSSFTGKDGESPASPPDDALKDTLWCMIALNMTNAEYDRAPFGAWLLSVAHKDGSVAFDSALGEVEATALCVIALSKNTDDDGKTAYNGCMEYLINACDEDGFFVDSDENAQKDPSDQAMAIAAVISAGENIYGSRWAKKGKTVVDCLISFQTLTGGFPEPEETDGSVTAKCIFALLCAQADSMIWSNYAIPDIPKEPAA